MNVLSYDSSAPWNRKEPSGAIVTKQVMITISKPYVDIETFETHEDWDGDQMATFPNDDADLYTAYRDGGMTVPDLLGKLAEIAEKKVKNMEAEIKASANRHEAEKNLNKQIRYWREIMDACKGWKIEEIEID